MVICLERGADLHMAQLMPLPLTASCFSKIQIGFTFLVPAHPGSPGKRAVKRVRVCVTFTQDFNLSDCRLLLSYERHTRGQYDRPLPTPYLRPSKSERRRRHRFAAAPASSYSVARPSPPPTGDREPAGRDGDAATAKPPDAAGKHAVDCKRWSVGGVA